MQKEQLEDLEMGAIMAVGDFEDELIKQYEKEESSDKPNEIAKKEVETYLENERQIGKKLSTSRLLQWWKEIKEYIPISVSLQDKF